MSVEAWDIVLNAKIDNPTVKAVLLGLANHASPEGKHIYPSVKRLSIYTSLSESTVRTKLAELRKTEIIKVVRKAHRYRPTEYEMDLEKLKSMRHPDLQLLEASSNPPTSRGTANGGLGDQTSGKPTSDLQERASGLQPTEGEPSLTVKEPSLNDSKKLFSSQDPWSQVLAEIGSTYYHMRMHQRNSDWQRYWSLTSYGGQQDGKYIVLCKTEEQRAWLQDRGKKMAETKLIAVLCVRAEIEFVVDEQ